MVSYPVEQDRNIWPLIREHLPKKGRKEVATGGEPKLPKELEGARHSLYSNHEKNTIRAFAQGQSVDGVAPMFRASSN